MKNVAPLILFLFLGLVTSAQKSDSMNLSTCDPMPGNLYKQTHLVSLVVENGMAFCRAHPKTLGPELERLQNLRKLAYTNARNNDFAPLPAALKHLQKLEYLRTNSIIPEIQSLTNLQSLDLIVSSTEAAQVLAGIDFSKFPKLESLKLNFYSVKNIEDLRIPGLLELFRLREVEVTSPPMAVQEDLLQLSQLESFRLYGPKEVPDDAFVKTVNLKALNMPRAGLERVPASVTSLQKLEILILSENKLQALPADIGQLKSLKGLFLSGNQLASVPASIGQLSQLRELNLRSNDGLTSLPASIGQLKKLEYLNVGWCKLETVPQSLTGMTGLKELLLSHNKLRELPGGWERMTLLEVLELEANQIRELPASIYKLPALKDLKVSQN